MARAGLIALGVLVLAAQAHGGTGARASRTDWTFMRAAAALDRDSIASGKLAASQAAARPLRARLVPSRPSMAVGSCKTSIGCKAVETIGKTGLTAMTRKRHSGNDGKYITARESC